MNGTNLKRCVSLLVSLVVLISSVSFSSFAADEKSGMCGENLAWSFDSASRTLHITGEGRMFNYRSWNSGTYNTPWSQYISSIKTVIIDEGCTEIGEYAFSGCNTSTYIFPETSLKRINKGAFHWNASLASIEIPDSVEYLGEEAFDMCYHTKSVKLGDGLTSIERYTFDDMWELTDVVIGKNVRTLRVGAFNNCYDLKELDLSAIEVLYTNAVTNCTSLTEINLGENLRAIGSGAFNGCSALGKIAFSSVPAEISSSYGTGTLEYANRPDGIFTVCGGKVLCSKGKFSGEKLEIPEGVEIVADEAFANSENLREIVFPASLKTIGYMSFFNAKNIEAVAIPETVEKIGASNFGHLQKETTLYRNYSVKITAKHGSAAYRYAMDNGLDFVCDHVFELERFVEDCTLGGKIFNICGCGLVNRSGEVAPADHVSQTTVISATCRQEGVIITSCKNCDVIISEKIIEKKAHNTTDGHSFTKEPTCTEPGTMTVSCNVCMQVVGSYDIAPKGHSENLLIKTVASTCNKEGTRYGICPDCKEKAFVETLPKKDHKGSGTWETVTKPSQDGTVPGLMIKLCPDCNEIAEIYWHYSDTSEAVETAAALSAVFPALATVCAGGGECAFETVDFNSDGIVSAKDSLYLSKCFSENEEGAKD